eukprot:scaffold84880_cov31-Prasinocladus_malaysianus.AAC.2
MRTNEQCATTANVARYSSSGTYILVECSFLSRTVHICTVLMKIHNNVGQPLADPYISYRAPNTATGPISI